MRTPLLLVGGAVLTAALFGTSYALLANAGAPNRPSGSAPTSHASSPIPAGDSNQHGYVALGDDGAIFVQWTERDHQLQGQLHFFNPNDSARTFNASLSGSHVDSSISVVIAGRTLTGTLKGDTLTLVIPQNDGSLSTTELHPGTVGEFNAKVRQLQQAAAFRDATATAASEHEAEATAKANKSRTAVAASRYATATAETAATEQRTCAAVHGHLVPGNFLGRPYERCRANSPTPGCEVIDFNIDGTISLVDLKINNDFYLGCFPAAASVPADVAH